MKVLDKKYYSEETENSICNFSVSDRRIPRIFIKALAEVKQACTFTNIKLGYIEEKIAEKLIESCKELRVGKFDDQIVVDICQGGAGTSTNMNINEVLANLAPEKLGYQIHPIHHINLHQSTNDVYSTALKIAILYSLKEMESSIQSMQGVLQKKELEFKNVVKLGRTQLQDAVPMTLSMEFGVWGEAIERILYRTDICLAVIDEKGITDIDLNILKKVEDLKIPFIVIFNKPDLRVASEKDIKICLQNDWQFLNYRECWKEPFYL